MRSLIKKQKERLKKFHAYSSEYDYDEVKIACVLSVIATDLDYGQLFEVTRAIYGIWIDGIDCCEIDNDDLLNFQGDEEGYAQEYATRIGKQFIKEYFG